MNEKTNISNSNNEIRFLSPIDKKVLTFGNNPNQKINYEGGMPALVYDFLENVAIEFSQLSTLCENLTKKSPQEASFQDLIRISEKFNKYIEENIDVFKDHKFSTAEKRLLKYIVTTCYLITIKEPKKLNKYTAFSPEVYGEISFDSFDEIVSNLNFEDKIRFIDLGSGVGQVVLQMAGSFKCEKCYGIERASVPYEYSIDLSNLFKNMMDWFGKTYSDFEIIKGDFMDIKFREIINNSTFIFANNLAFGPQLNHDLKMRFFDLNDGCSILSTDLFTPLNFRVTARNLNDVGAMLHVKVLLASAPGSVSWTSKPLSFYLHTIDHAFLQQNINSIAEKQKMDRSNLVGSLQNNSISQIYEHFANTTVTENSAGNANADASYSVAQNNTDLIDEKLTSINTSTKNKPTQKSNHCTKSYSALGKTSSPQSDQKLSTDIHPRLDIVSDKIENPELLNHKIENLLIDPLEKDIQNIINSKNNRNNSLSKESTRIESNTTESQLKQSTESKVPSSHVKSPQNIPLVLNNNPPVAVNSDNIPKNQNRISQPFIIRFSQNDINQNNQINDSNKAQIILQVQDGHIINLNKKPKDPKTPEKNPPVNALSDESSINIIKPQNQSNNVNLNSTPSEFNGLNPPSRLIHLNHNAPPENGINEIKNPLNGSIDLLKNYTQNQLPSIPPNCFPPKPSSETIPPTSNSPNIDLKIRSRFDDLNALLDQAYAAIIDINLLSNQRGIGSYSERSLITSERFSYIKDEINRLMLYVTRSNCEFIAPFQNNPHENDDSFPLSVKRSFNLLNGDIILNSKRYNI